MTTSYHNLLDTEEVDFIPVITDHSLKVGECPLSAIESMIALMSNIDYVYL